MRDVAPVVPAAAETEDASGRKALRDGAEPRRRVGMRFLGQREVGNRVPAEAVGATPLKMNY